jgi:hypothetical protein
MLQSPSPSGDASSKTSNIALLASEYAFIRGWTTITSGQRRRASAADIAVLTPNAFAS